MTVSKKPLSAAGLLALLLVYCAASLTHFVHNAVFLESYPNLPAWFSSAGVMAAWVGVTLVGVVGYGLFRAGHRLTGLIVMGIYAALGLDGLAHYTRAPISAHSFTMNFTIGFEVLAAAVVLIVVTINLFRVNLLRVWPKRA